MDPRMPLGLTEARMAMDRGAGIEAALAVGLAAMDAARGVFVPPARIADMLAALEREAEPNGLAPVRALLRTLLADAATGGEAGGLHAGPAPGSPPDAACVSAAVPEAATAALSGSREDAGA